VPSQQQQPSYQQTTFGQFAQQYPQPQQPSSPQQQQPSPHYHQAAPLPQQQQPYRQTIPSQPQAQQQQQQQQPQYHHAHQPTATYQQQPQNNKAHHHHQQQYNVPPPQQTQQPNYYVPQQQQDIVEEEETQAEVTKVEPWEVDSEVINLNDLIGKAAAQAKQYGEMLKYMNHRKNVHLFDRREFEEVKAKNLYFANLGIKLARARDERIAKIEKAHKDSKGAIDLAQGRSDFFLRFQHMFTQQNPEYQDLINAFDPVNQLCEERVKSLQFSSMIQ
jgi:hypothetical protein